MIIKSFTANCTTDGAAKRLADERHNIPAEIVTWGWIIEGQIDICDRRAPTVNCLEHPITTGAADGGKTLVEAAPEYRPLFLKLLEKISRRVAE